MDKTLFELVPVSVPPEKEGWYWVQHDSIPGFPSSALFRDNKWWDIGDEDPGYFETDATHYLRPLPRLLLKKGRLRWWRRKKSLKRREKSISLMVRGQPNYTSTVILNNI